MRGFGKQKKRSQREQPHPKECRRSVLEFLQLPESRALLHRIRSAHDERRAKSILILSQFPREGRTFLTSVLAEAAVTLFSQRVLIVDTDSTDLAHAPYFTYLGRDRSEGPGDPLEPASIEVAIAKRIRHQGTNETQSHPAHEETLDLLPDFDVGAYLTAVRDQYDLVLIDGCALSSVGRATLHPAILSVYSDSTILVVSPRSIERNALRSMQGLLAQHRIRPFGIVHNRWVVA